MCKNLIIPLCVYKVLLPCCERARFFLRHKKGRNRLVISSAVLDKDTPVKLVIIATTIPCISGDSSLLTHWSFRFGGNDMRSIELAPTAAPE